MINNDNSLAVIQQNIGLSPDIFSKLKSYDDYVNFYVQLEEVSSGFSWMKADILLQMEQTMGEKSLREFSKEVKQPLSTTTNYIRVARAFPPDKRDAGASFSLHFQASFADSYNEDSKSFDSDKRFEWLNKALDGNMSTRKLLQEIQKEKELQQITTGDQVSLRKFTVNNIVKEINTAVGAIAQKAIDGSTEHSDKLIKIKAFIYG